MNTPKIGIRLGRIDYLNTLPIYYPLDSGQIPHGCTIISGAPSRLNTLMANGQLDISSNSSIEYGRRPNNYLLVPDLAIGSSGPVQSVLLLSKRPLEQLDGVTILVSEHTHTSAMLLRLLLYNYMQINAEFVTRHTTATLTTRESPEAILTIGDEALTMRYHRDYPVHMDLGEAWQKWTGLPFIFGIWVVRRAAYKTQPVAIKKTCIALLRSKTLGIAQMEHIIKLTASRTKLSVADLQSYYAGLLYNFGLEEQRGLTLFYQLLVEAELLSEVPKLKFLDLTESHFA